MILALFLLTFSLYSFGQSDPFIGSFSNGQITIQFTESAGNYAGFVKSQEGSFNLVAKSYDQKSIQGTYNYFGTNIPFSGTIQGNTLSIYSEGQSINLQKQTDPNLNPSNNISSNQNTIGATRNDEWGISFNPPAGWSSQTGEGGYTFVSPDQRSLIFLIPNQEAKTIDQLKVAARQGIMDQNIRFNISGEPKLFGTNGISSEFEGMFNQRQAKCFAIGILSPFGIGATILAISETKDYNEDLKNTATQHAKSISFYQPKVAVDPSGNVADWQQYLKGRKLEYYKTSTGFTDHIIFWLCSDGSFARKDDTSSFSSGAVSSFSGVANSNNAGRWSANGSGNTGTLILQYNDGSSASYQVELRDGKFYMNGRKYFRVKNDRCQ
ncbi:hypothetical protein [Flexithrix dorotheae]|uniref:hypothetical protein n=1 Tax=Flexithrix dorotheae TaxID=70993 RepID=UPI00146BED70|nr:hypothetical protein [Flexithrix dorotheae]